MKYTRILGWVLLSAVSVSPIVASVRYELCSQLVETALEAADQVCDELGRNLACYGHSLLTAEAQDGIDSFQFEEAGDRVEVASLNSLRLSPMNVDDGTWGVALMNIQANIPNEQPENVNLVLFGDVEVENIVREPVLMNVVLDSDGNANIRREPNNTSFVMASIPAGTVLEANGRSEDGVWISVGIPDTDGEKGWVSRNLIESVGNLDELNVVQPYLNQYGPMQAFYLRTGDQQSTCAEAPNDGLLVQTPEGVAEVRLWINEVKIRLGSTAFIQAEAGNQMTIKTLEGKAIVESLGVEQIAVAGTGIQIQLNDQSGASSVPSVAKPYQKAEVDNLPIEELDRPIDVEVLPPAPSTTEPDGPAAVTSPEASPDDGQQPELPATPTPTDVSSATPLPETTEAPGDPTPEATENGSGSTGDPSGPTDEPTDEPPEATDPPLGSSSQPDSPPSETPPESPGDSTPAEETAPAEETPDGFLSLIGNLLLNSLGNQET